MLNTIQLQNQQDSATQKIKKLTEQEQIASFRLFRQLLKTKVELDSNIKMKFDQAHLAIAKQILKELLESYTNLSSEMDFQKKAESAKDVPTITLDDPFNIELKTFKSLPKKEYLALAKKAYRMMKKDIETEFKRNPSLQEVLVCEGEVIAKSDTLGGLTKEVIFPIVEQRGKSFYIFTRPTIEESHWVDLTNDVYPTMNVQIGATEWNDARVSKEGRKILADFDTGSRPIAVFDEAVVTEFVQPAEYYEYRTAGVLGKEFTFFLRDVKLGLEDIKKRFRVNVIQSHLVADWDASPLVEVNPNREGLVGRKMMHIFNINLTLKPNEKITVIEFVDDN